MRYSPKQRLDKLLSLQKGFEHLLRKYDIKDEKIVKGLVAELLIHMDMEFFTPYLTQEEWEALPINQKYTPEELKEIFATSEVT